MTKLPNSKKKLIYIVAAMILFIFIHPFLYLRNMVNAHGKHEKIDVFLNMFKNFVYDFPQK